MKKFLLFGLLLLLLAACSQTQSPPKELVSQGRNERSTWSYADAFFSRTDGCVVTEVDVAARVDSSKTNKPKLNEKGAAAYVSIRQYDCEGQLVLGVSGYDWDADFTVNGLVNRATLKAAFELGIWVGEDWQAFPVTVEVGWHGTGKLERGKFRFSNRNPPDFLYHGQQSFYYRSSKASGIVMNGAANFIEGISGDGFMNRSDSKTLTVDRRAPVIYDFFATCETIFEGGRSDLIWWGVDGAQPITVSLEPGIGDVTGEYYVTVAPEETTTYTLTATNKRGTSTAQATVNVEPPPGPDEFEEGPEGNDSPESATPIDLDFSRSELNLVAGDVDWFRFELPELARLSALADSDIYCGAFTIVGLFKQANGGLEEIEIGEWGGLRIWLEPGTYYLAVSGSQDYDFTGDHNEIGFYNLTVTATPPPQPDEFEPDDIPEDATVIEDFPFSSPQLTLLPNDVDWFTFDVTETAELFASADTEEFLLIGLFKQIGDNVEPIDWWFNWGGWAALEPGTYYLAVSGYPDFDFTGDHDQAGSYSLKVMLFTP